MDQLEKPLTDEYLAEEQAKYCSIFSNSRRVQILWALMDGEMSVGAIALKVNSSIQNISQHLNKMKEYKIVSARRDGHTIYYRIEKEKIAEKCTCLQR